MCLLHVILICLAAIITAFFSVLWGWLIIGIPSIFLLLALFGVKQNKQQYIPEVSEMANKMLQKYGQYYAFPFAAKDFSASASTVMFSGAALAILSAFQGFWLGIGIGFLNWCLMGLVTKAFNPTNFLTDPLEQKAHDEIIEYLTEREQSKMHDT